MVKRIRIAAEKQPESGQATLDFETFVRADLSSGRAPPPKAKPKPKKRKVRK